MTYAYDMTVELDEEYPFLIEAYGKVTGALNLPVWGKALIDYNDPDDWTVSSFTLDADNYVVRKSNIDSWTVTLDEGPIFEAVKNYIEKIRREYIESKIHDVLFEDDPDYRRDLRINDAA